MKILYNSIMNRPYKLLFNLNCLLFLLVIGSSNLIAQNFIQLSDATGYVHEQSEIDELEQLATDLINALPQEFQSEFKIYDFGYYLHNDQMDDESSPSEIWLKIIENVEIQSDYYIVFGREINYSGYDNTLRINFKIPETDIFECVDEVYFNIIENGIINSSRLIVSDLEQELGFQKAAFTGQKNSINKLLEYVTKLSECCELGSRSEECNICEHGGEEFEAHFNKLGYFKLGGNSISIENKSYTAILSTKRISFYKDGDFIDFSDDLEQFASASGSRIRITEYTDLNCYSIADHPDLLGSEDYIEDIVILNFDGYQSIMTKIDFEISPEVSRINQNDRALPYLVYEALRRLAMAATSVIIDLAINISIEWWVGDHSSLEQAWENYDVSMWEIYESAKDGALADKKLGSFILTSLTPVSKWIIKTPANQLSWSGFGNQLLYGLNDAVMEKLVDKYLDKFKKISKKYSNLPSNDYLYFSKDLEAIVESNPQLYKKLGQNKIEIVYNRFSKTSPLRKNGKYLEKVQKAMAPPDRWKIAGQKLGYVGSSKHLGDNIKYRTGKSKPANFAAHHICPSGDPRGDEARQLLMDHGIDINEAVNGVYLPQGSKYVDNGQANHKTIHTNDYYEELTKELKMHVGNPEAMRKALDDISQLLLINKFPH